MTPELLPTDLNHMEEIINPGEFTEKELLKLVYRDLHRLRTEFEDYKKHNDSQRNTQKLELQIIKLENRFDLEDAVRAEGKKQMNRTVYVIGFVLMLLQFVLKYIVK